MQNRFIGLIQVIGYPFNKNKRMVNEVRKGLLTSTGKFR